MIEHDINSPLMDRPTAITPSELLTILTEHAAWLREEPAGRRADLSGAVLHGADLSGAVLRRAVLHGADLSGAVLHGAVLHSADLSSADLSSADLHGAVLHSADLSGAVLPHFGIPEFGPLRGWKKLAYGCIAEVEIPANARMTACLINRKCRASMVLTRGIWDANGKRIAEMHGQLNSSTAYRVGFPTYPDKYDDDIRVDCTHGIHFFLTRREAEEW